MDDLISRQGAIDAFWKIDIEMRPSAIDAVLNMLKTLPSAQSEQRWISCSKGLPNAGTEVIVSCLDDSGDTSFAYTGSGWLTTNKEYWIVDNEICSFVVAWCEMPKPYRGEGGE